MDLDGHYVWRMVLSSKFIVQNDALQHTGSAMLTTTHGLPCQGTNALSVYSWGRQLRALLNVFSIKKTYVVSINVFFLMPLPNFHVEMVLP